MTPKRLKVTSSTTKYLHGPVPEDLVDDLCMLRGPRRDVLRKAFKGEKNPKTPH